MACIETLNTCATQGNDWFINITVTATGAVDTETGEPIDPKDLTGSTIVFTFKDTIDGSVVVTPTQDLTDLATGRIGFSLTAAQTETLIQNPNDNTRTLTGAPQVTYSDGTVDDLFTCVMEVHESWN